MNFANKILSKIGAAPQEEVPQNDILTKWVDLPCSDYILFCPEGFSAIDIYPYWGVVFSLLKNLSDRPITVVQLLHSSEVVDGVDFALKVEDIPSLNFVCNHAAAYIGASNITANIAATKNKPVVTIHSSFSPDLECIKFGRNWKSIVPKSNFSEMTKNITSEISPVEIVEAFFGRKVPVETFHLGDSYGKLQNYLIPTSEENIAVPNSGDNIVRMDLEHNETFLKNVTSVTEVSVVTTQPFDLSSIDCSKLKYVLYISDGFDEEFVKQLAEKSIKHGMFYTGEDLASERLKFFYELISQYSEKENVEDLKKKYKVCRPQTSFVFCCRPAYCGAERYNTLYEFTQNEDHFFLDLDQMVILNH